MPINSRAKGARGELEAVNELKRIYGLKAIRTGQVNGKLTSDIIGEDGDLDGLHIEVKRPAKLAIMKYFQQAERDCKEHNVPVVMMRPDGDKRWVVAMRLDQMEDVLRRFFPDEK